MAREVGDPGTHVVPDGPYWKHKERMTMKKYLKRLHKELTDERNLLVELMLIWIAGMMTLLVLFAILASCEA